MRSRSSQIAQGLETTRFQVAISAPRPGCFSTSLWAIRTESEMIGTIILSGLLLAFMESDHVE